jgi:hypothetical protein
LPAFFAEPAVPSASHRSTNVEQAEFQRSTGALFTRGLDELNAASADFRQLRGSAGAKADLVAVHLYLHEGEMGAVALNATLRAHPRASMSPASLPPAYLACLTSGLRRLPAHRGLVFRQACLPGSGRIGESYAEGDIVTEAGFLSATAADDLALPGGSVDFLIWSRSGRRTEDLRTGGLPQEIVFPARTRLKVLAVLEPVGIGAATPAVLMRELHPDETPTSRAFDTSDVAVLSKLRRAIQRRLKKRQANGIRILEDPDQISRLATPLGR